jgi:hypothetical protein
MESLILPSSIRESFMEDSVTDLLACELAGTVLSSLEEAKLFVRTHIVKYVQDSDSLVLSGGTDRIVSKLILFSQRKPAPLDGMLAKLVKGVKLADKYRTPLVNIYSLTDKEKSVIITIPYIDEKDSLSKRNFQLIATLLHYALGVAPGNISYHMDKNHGTTLNFEAVHIKLIEELISSAAMPSGAFPGEIMTVGDYKGNLPGLLASIHFLNRKLNYLRRRTPPKGKKIDSINTSVLRTLFNARTGLTDRSGSFATMLLKGALSVITSARNTNLPGGWIVSNRTINGVKSDTGLAYKLGYTEVIPYHHKLVKVLNTTTRIKPDGKLHLVTLEDKDKLSYPEFRTGAVLTAPVLESDDAEVAMTLVKRDPFHCKSAKVLDTFKNVKFYKMIDSLDRCHAILLSCGKSQKTKPIHYEQARNELLHLSAKCPIIDGSSTERTKLSEIRKSNLDFCSKLYRHKLGDGNKRSAEDAMDVDVETSLKRSPHVKRQKRVDSTTREEDSEGNTSEGLPSVRAPSVLPLPTSRHGKRQASGSRAKIVGKK